MQGTHRGGGGGGSGGGISSGGGGVSARVGKLSIVDQSGSIPDGITDS